MSLTCCDAVALLLGQLHQNLQQLLAVRVMNNPDCVLAAVHQQCVSSAVQTVAAFCKAALLFWVCPYLLVALVVDRYLGAAQPVGL